MGQAGNHKKGTECGLQRFGLDHPCPFQNDKCKDSVIFHISNSAFGPHHP